jgi:AraC-like DNA-binding protein
MIPDRENRLQHAPLAHISSIEERICESVGPVGVRTVGEEQPRFHHEWRNSYIGPTLVTKLRGLQIERHEGALAERWSDSVFLVLQKEGTARCWEAGLEFRANAGDMVLIDPCLGSSIGSEGSCQFLSYTMPRTVVTALQDRGLDPMHKVIGRAGAVTHLLAGTLGAMLNPAQVDDRAKRSACQVVCDLLAEALKAQEEATCDPDIVLVEAMRQWTISHVGFDRIGAAELAREFGLSERGLYRLFARQGTTPDRWLWRCQIEAATKRMELPNASIKAIALETGFKNMPHFTRMFRKVHGVPPTVYRRGSVGRQ